MNAFGISVAPEEFQRIIDENLGGLESVKAVVSDSSGIMSNLIKRSSGWRRLNCSTCIWVWPNRQRIYTWPQETRLYCVHTCPNQQRWIEKTTWWCYLPLTFFRRFFNQVRTTESSAEEQQCLHLGIKYRESLDEIQTLILNPPMLKYFDVAEQVD